VDAESQKWSWVQPDPELIHELLQLIESVFYFLVSRGNVIGDRVMQTPFRHQRLAHTIQPTYERSAQLAASRDLATHGLVLRALQSINQSGPRRRSQRTASQSNSATKTHSSRLCTSSAVRSASCRPSSVRRQVCTHTSVTVVIVVVALRTLADRSGLLPERDHFFLKSDRPRHISLHSIVRDAVSRLPCGLGTRADVVTLVRDSQYVADNVTDAQVNSVVSGALDRLHSEKDPCVRYDSSQRLWTYLHKRRRPQDFYCRTSRLRARLLSECCCRGDLTSHSQPQASTLFPRGKAASTR